ncbi:probable LRR receptor-like serine/threonine-protein kinase At3g47570 [Cornus florida]|uniref:probable LRR receptor-like serine/threonine-protein kinase At3g47570 n=1 Tax=Cornus florida TaxID=4283 RepID=UPI00289AA243|nr:probable LRR receptor-like serine/threonine-protein kinase At3g47570 [Cornus florida]
MVLAFWFCWVERKKEVQPSESLLKEPFMKVSYKRLLEVTDGFSSANLIGVESYGSVYKGILDGEENTLVAVKVLNLLRRRASKSFMTECEVFRSIRHRNLVKVITSCSSFDFQGNDFKALVYEFMPNGSLQQWLHSSSETNNGQRVIQSLTLLQRINIAIDVACALEYLHHHCQTPIIHCNLMPSNIFLDSDLVAHVGHFGLAKFFQKPINPKQSSSKIEGTY